MIPTVDHVEAGVERQRPSLRSASGDALTRVFLAPFQELAVAIRQLMTYRSQGLDGTGYALDEYGGRIALPRAGRDEDEYAIALRARVGLLNSDGTGEDIIQLLRLLLGREEGTRIRITPLGGSAIVELLGRDNLVWPFAMSDLNALLRLVQPASEAGTRIYLSASAYAEADSFRFATQVSASPPGPYNASTINIAATAGIPDDAWCQAPGNPVIHYRRTAPTVMSLDTPLTSAFSAGQSVQIVKADGSPWVPGKGFGQGRLMGVVG